MSITKGSERFRPFFKNAWIKANYKSLNPNSEEIVHPIKYCFGSNNGSDNCEELLCELSVLLRCAYCKRYICFTHFFDEYHYKCIK